MNPQSILVTGAASGIGLACSRDLLADGHQVAALDVSEDALKTAHPEPHERLVLVAGDVSEAPDCKRAVAQTVDVFGQLNRFHRITW
ncbi:SDR family NAD(P)-dependent oxidoreductase [Candidatus Entotheonella palauensis]|uniref:SDR family NAD(P)-dependent oxidoreductase n=1 Tax=Candidatus Entotheonella palauensis TaxID=93172 RepID=UPI000B7D476B|nr:SDR family NAD(P)-dependent oxidoreductase [Candidatus Entotheonella palauensis]